MSTYSYTISGDFSGISPKYNQLHTEIVNEAGITVTLLGINSEEDNIDIVFKSDLSASQQTVLNGIISNYTPEANKGSIISNITVVDSNIDSTIYSTIGSFNFPGTSVWKNITNIKVIGFMEEGGTSYDVKIYDIKNRNQICWKNLNNIDEDICDLGIFTNLPTNESIFEIQSKVNGLTVAHVKNINIYHD